MRSLNSFLLKLFGTLIICLQGLNAETYFKDGSNFIDPDYDWKIEKPQNESSTLFAGKWIIAPEPGALKVGPEPGSGLWWQVTEATLSERICYLDDIYEFGEDGSFKNILGDETILEPFQGVSEIQCGALVAPHDGSLDASYQYTPETGKLTLIGKGAFLGLAKVVNGSELEDPNAAPETITYDVSFSESGNRMTLMIESNQGVFWTYELIKEAVFIADYNFEQALIDLGIDSDGTLNHRILRSEAVGVTELHISDPINNQGLPNVNEKIKNLTGIEAFTSLSVLDCRKNQIQELNLFNNTQLTELLGTENQLTELDISNNPVLSVLNIDNNQIQELDLSNNLALTILECGRNQLTDLDVRNNLSLRVLGFGLNNISEINVSKNLALEMFWCNGNPITHLDLDANTNLTGYGLSGTPLEYVTLRNGNNINVSYFEAYNTPKLNCIRSDAEISDRMNLPYKTFSEDCSTSIAGKWIIAPEAGALKVGPEPRSGLWWQVTEATLSERICYFDDIYEFGEDGSFKNILGDETFLSEFQGVSELQCGALVAPHDGSLDASYQYTPETGKLTLIGKGAFLGLAKVVNGSELEDPNAAPETITYNVSFSENGNRMTLVIESDQGVFWTYELIKEAVFIADNNFEQAMIDLNIDSDGTINHRILRSDAEAVTELNLNNPVFDNSEFANSEIVNVSGKITDLTGIEAFTNLISLQAAHGKLTKIDISANVKLEELFLNDNLLSSIDISMLPNLKRFGIMRNNMTSGIVVSGNPLLEELFIHHTGISSIELYNNPNLWNLSIQNNNLTSLNLSSNTALRHLSVQYNQLSELNITPLSVIETVDAQFNENMTLVTGTNGYPTLTSLNLSGTGLNNFDGAIYPNLERLLLNDNNLSNFNGNNYLNLQQLYLNNNAISKISLTEIAQLVEMHVMNNGMEELDLRNGNNSILGTMEATGNSLTCISVDAPEDTSKPYSQWKIDQGVILSDNCKQAEEVILIPDENFERALIDLEMDSNGLTGNILVSDAEAVKSLNVSNSSIIDATGIEGFVNLESLDFSNNLLDKIDLTENTRLTSITVSQNQLTGLMIGNPKSLVEFRAESNELNQLNWGDLTNLEILDVSGNLFTSIDLKELNKLKSVDVSSNELTNLDLRNGNNSAITLMDAAGNPNLQCIGVDDESNTPDNWFKDPSASYTNSGDCEAPSVVTKNVTVYLDKDGLAEVTPADIDNGSSDNVTPQKNLFFELDNPIFDCDDLGENLVTLSVTDESGNIGSAQATITVVDEFAPSALSLRTYTLDLAGAASVDLSPADIDDGSSDNCNSLEFSIDQSSFSFPGEYEVSFTATDGSGNSSSSITTVEVIDSHSNPTLLKFRGNLVVTVYPNPFSNYMRLSFSQSVNLNNVQVRVYQGAGLIPGVYFSRIGNELVSYNIGTVLNQTGQYILSITIEGETKTALIMRN